MIRILFICHGNICRSAAAEMVLRKKVKDLGKEDLFRIESAATSREEIGNDIYPPMKTALQRRGYPCLAHAARQTVKSDYSRWDYLVGMDDENIRNMRRIYGTDPEGRISMLMDWAGRPGEEIDDPWYTRDFAGALAQIEEGCSGLIRACMSRQKERSEKGNTAVSRPYADLHCDTLYAAWRRGAEDIFQLDNAMADVSKIRKGGCRLQLYAIFMPPSEDTTEAGAAYPGDEAYIKTLHDIFRRTVQRHPDIFAAAGSMRDVERNTAAGKVSGMLSMEDGRAVAGSFDKIRQFHEMGIRVMGLTWNSANCFGYPNSFDAEEMKRGLTAFGKESVSCMNEIGMLIDVSHLSDGGFWDVARLSRRPFIASHSNCRTLNPHPRSLTDEMIRALADSGGVMGLNFAPLFSLRIWNSRALPWMIWHSSCDTASGSADWNARQSGRTLTGLAGNWKSHRRNRCQGCLRLWSSGGFQPANWMPSAGATRNAFSGRLSADDLTPRMRMNQGMTKEVAA